MDLFLAGGGTTEQEAQVWAAAFAGVTNVLYWPFALADERAPAAEAWLSDGMHSLGITAAVSMWTSLAGHDAPELAGYDLVFVGGGTTSKLVNHNVAMDSTPLWLITFAAAAAITEEAPARSCPANGSLLPA